MQISFIFSCIHNSSAVDISVPLLTTPVDMIPPAFDDLLVEMMNGWVWPESNGLMPNDGCVNANGSAGCCGRYS